LSSALELVEKLDKEVRAIRTEIIKLCWWMRGGITLDEGFALTYEDKEIIGELVKENLETTKKSGLPFF
jgi:hypothetical protein